MPMPRINPALRTTLYHLGNTSLLHSAGKQAYHSIALHVAKRLANLEGVTQVYWRGGSINRCTPGVSDLDFSIFISHPTIKSIDQIRHHYTHLKKRYLLPSELSIHLEGESSIYLNLLLNQSRRWEGRWHDHVTAVDPKIRLAGAIEQLDQSYWSLRQTIENGENSFYTGFFLRDTAKTTALSVDSAEWQIQRASADELLTKAFESVDALARNLGFNKKNEKLDLDFETSPLEQMWLDEFLKLGSHHYKLKRTPLPFAYILENGNKTEFFTELLNFLRFSKLGKFPVRIFSQAQWNAISSGYCGWSRIHNRNLAQLNTPFNELRERAQLQLALWLGEVLTGSARRAEWLLENVKVAINIIAQHQPSPPPEILSTYRSLHHTLSSLVSPANTQ